MTDLEENSGRLHSNDEAIYLSWLEKFLFLEAVTKAGANDAIGKLMGKTVRMDVDHFHDEVRITGTR